MAYNSLAELFKATADAIRSKTGGTDPIVANNFPAAIEGISGGGGGATTIDTGRCTGSKGVLSICISADFTGLEECEVDGFPAYKVADVIPFFDGTLDAARFFMYETSYGHDSETFGTISITRKNDYWKNIGEGRSGMGVGYDWFTVYHNPGEAFCAQVFCLGLSNDSFMIYAAQTQEGAELIGVPSPGVYISPEYMTEGYFKQLVIRNIWVTEA